MSDSTGLLARWNLRRQQVEAENEAENEVEGVVADPVNPPAIDDIETNEQEIASVSNEESEQVLTAEDLPDPEQIEVGGSFADFMATNVDPKAKTDALRALWKQPHFNEIDGLLEYGLDYTNQPILSAQVSAELTNKVFRYIMKDESEEEQEGELVADASNEIAEENEQIADSISLKDEEVAIIDESIEDVTQDNLGYVMLDLSQNEPEL